jgi:hypothetical protein
MDGIRGAGPASRPAGPSCRRRSLFPSGLRGARPASRPERPAVQCPRTCEIGHATGEKGGVPLAVLNSPTVRAWHAGWGVRYRRGAQLRACAWSIMRPGDSVPLRYSNLLNVRGRHVDGGIGYRRSTQLAERARSGNQGRCHCLHDRVPRPWIATHPRLRGARRPGFGRGQHSRRILQKGRTGWYDRCDSGGGAPHRPARGGSS